MGRLVDVFGLSAPGVQVIPWTVVADVSCGAGVFTDVIGGQTFAGADSGVYQLFVGCALAIANGASAPAGLTIKVQANNGGTLSTLTYPPGLIGAGNATWLLPGPISCFYHSGAPFSDTVHLQLNPTTNAMTVKQNSFGYFAMWRNAD